MTLRCPEHGLLSLRCSHEELKLPPWIGYSLMGVGAFTILIGLAEITGLVKY